MKTIFFFFLETKKKSIGLPLKEKDSQVERREGKGVPVVAQQIKNPTGILEDAGSIADPAHRVKDLALP